jgi:sulfite exporter TauE/SafE/copper chaperone CopZ
MSFRQTFKVSGTTCASCEIVLERSLKKLADVDSVVASHTDGVITIISHRAAPLTVQDLENAVGPSKYRFLNVDSTPSQEKHSWKQVGPVGVLVLALYLLLKQFGLLTFSPTVESGSGLGAIFLIGLVAAFSSCTAVVGGLVVAVSSAAARKNPLATPIQKLRPHILFHIGRFLGFAAFGALTGWLGSVLVLSTTGNAILVIVIAILMLILGINLLEIFPRGLWGAVHPPKWLSHRIHALSSSSHPVVPLLLGIATYFLPCGFTQSMQLYALSTGNPVQAALVMSVFALGTAPALFGLGALTAYAKGPWLGRLTRAAGALVVVLGVSNLQNGARLLGWTPPHSSSPETESVTDAFIENGTQVIQMEVTSRATYVPDVLTIQAGVPTKWEIYGAKQMGCASTLVVPTLGVSQSLRPGYNQIALAPLEAGTYPFTCSMGMTDGTLIVR